MGSSDSVRASDSDSRNASIMISSKSRFIFSTSLIASSDDSSIADDLGG